MPNYTVPPVNYNAFGSVINQPDSPQDYVNTSRAQMIEPPIEMWKENYSSLYKQGKYYPQQEAVDAFKRDNPNVQLTPAQEYVIFNEGYLPNPYYLSQDEKNRGILTQGVGQTKRKGKDYIALGFQETYKDKIANLKSKIDSKFIDTLELNDPEKFAALADLSYRGDVFPKWGKLYEEGKPNKAYTEFWNRKKFGGAALDRVEKNSMILFGKGVPKGTKTSDGKKW